MAKKTILSQVEEAIAGGKVTRVAGNKFISPSGETMKARSMTLDNEPLQVGDEVTIPRDYEVLQTKIGDNTVSFIFAEVKSANGEERNIRFSPNSLAKIVFAIDPDTNAFIGKFKTTGTVAQWFAERAGQPLDDVVKELAGKPFVVSDKKVYLAHNRFTDEDQRTSIFEYNWKYPS